MSKGSRRGQRRRVRLRRYRMRRPRQRPEDPNRLTRMAMPRTKKTRVMASAPRAMKAPIRTCAGCGARRPKGEMIRVGAGQSGEVVVAGKGKSSGRGAYLCPDFD